MLSGTPALADCMEAEAASNRLDKKGTCLISDVIECRKEG